MSEPKHSALPWSTPDCGRIIGPSCVVAWTGGSGFITVEEIEANARLIVRAVNCHEQLVDALKTARDRLEYMFRVEGMTGEDLRLATAIEDAVIRKAEGA